MESSDRQGFKGQPRPVEPRKYKPNQTYMAFIRKKGKTKVMYFPRTASVVFDLGDLVYFTGTSGRVSPHPGGAEEVVGVCKKAVLSTDDDYATADVLIPIEVPIEKYVEWEFLTSGLVANDVGTYVDIATTDAGTVDRSTSADDIVLVTKRISATVGVGILSKTIWSRGD